MSDDMMPEDTAAAISELQRKAYWFLGPLGHSGGVHWGGDTYLQIAQE
jgi:hypothetical protein